MDNKAYMTREENIFYAKRNLVDTIYKSARLEGLAVTFPQTEAIIHGGNISGLKVDEITTINNLKHAWNFIFENLDYPLDYPFVCKLNQIIGSNLVQSAGFLRKGDVFIGGIDVSVWQPAIPNEDEFQLTLRRIRLIENPTERAIETMLYCARTQPFWDGNKRTAMLAANQILVSNGCGILSVSESNMDEFKMLLIDYYISGEKKSIAEFIYNKCIHGADLSKEREYQFKQLPELDLEAAKKQLESDRQNRSKIFISVDDKTQMIDTSQKTVSMANWKTRIAEKRVNNSNNEKSKVKNKSKIIER